MSLIATANPQARLDPAGTIANDIPCANCSYNLRALQPSQNCPECGIPVETSLRNDLLSDAPDRWRRRIAQGLTTLLVGVALTPVLLYIGVAIATVGLWLVTTAQPGRDEPRDDFLSRNTGRVLTLSSTAALLLLFAFILWKFSAHGTRGQWQTFDGILLVAHATYNVGLMASWVYLATLAARANAPRLSKRLTRLAVLWFVASGLVGLGGGIVSLFTHLLALDPGLMRLGRIAGYTLMVGTLIVTWWLTLSTLYKLRKQLQPLLRISSN